MKEILVLGDIVRYFIESGFFTKVLMRKIAGNCEYHMNLSDVIGGSVGCEYRESVEFL